MATSQKKTGINPATILVVEDEYSNFALIEVLLEPFHYRIIHAKNGQEAVDLCNSNPDIDMVIMDMKMPVMDGFEATRLIKRMRPELPVIAVTAYALSGDEEKAITAGCDGYLSKPFFRDELLQTISEHICL
jgi:CheY-like chemotaxis protein